MELLSGHRVAVVVVVVYIVSLQGTVSVVVEKWGLFGHGVHLSNSIEQTGDWLCLLSYNL